MKTTRQLSGPAKTRYLARLLERLRSGNATAVAEAADDIVRIWVREATVERRIGPALSQAHSEGAQAPGSEQTPVKAAPTPAAALDPYSFSAMAVMLKEGRPALEEILKPVASAGELLTVAKAQSITLDPALVQAPDTTLENLKAAFVAAVEKRIAHRRAIVS